MKPSTVLAVLCGSSWALAAPIVRFPSEPSSHRDLSSDLQQSTMQVVSTSSSTTSLRGSRTKPMIIGHPEMHHLLDHIYRVPVARNAPRRPLGQKMDRRRRVAMETRARVEANKLTPTVRGDDSKSGEEIEGSKSDDSTFSASLPRLPEKAPRVSLDHPYLQCQHRTAAPGCYPLNPHQVEMLFVVIMAFLIGIIISEPWSAFVKWVRPRKSSRCWMHDLEARMDEKNCDVGIMSQRGRSTSCGLPQHHDPEHSASVVNRAESHRH